MRQDLLLPTSADFDIIKYAVLELAEINDVFVQDLPEDNSLFFHVERIYSDCENWSWPPLVISFSGLLTTQPGWSSMRLDYKELSQNNRTINTSINHDYTLALSDSELVEFQHNMRVLPSIREPQADLTQTDEQMHMADLGKNILRTYAGENLELMAGDCGILYDRILFLTHQ